MEIEIPYNLAENFHSADGKGKKVFGKIGNFFMQGGLLGNRLAFLALVRLNPFGLASRFAAGFIEDPNFKPEVVAKAKPRWEKFKKTWKKLGGRVSALEKQIRLGYKQKPSDRIEKLIRQVAGKKSNAEGTENNYSNVTGLEEAVAVAEAIPVLVIAVKAIQGVGSPFKKETGPELDLASEALKDVENLKETAIKTDSEGNPVDPETGATIEADKIWGLPKNGVIAGGILILLGIVGTAIFFGFRKKNAQPAATAAK